MPNGITHFRTTLAILPVATIVTFAKTNDIGISMAIGAGCLVGTLVSCDLDVDGGNYSYYLVRRVTGNIGSFLWGVFWWPYAVVVPHRSTISHFPVISTIIRATYLLIPIIIIMMLLKIPLPTTISPLWTWAFLGLCLSDLLHIILDAFWKQKQ